MVRECLLEIDENIGYTLSTFDSAVELLAKSKETVFDIFILT